MAVNESDFNWYHTLATEAEKPKVVLEDRLDRLSQIVSEIPGVRNPMIVKDDKNQNRIYFEYRQSDKRIYHVFYARYNPQERSVDVQPGSNEFEIPSQVRNYLDKQFPDVHYMSGIQPETTDRPHKLFLVQ